MHLSASLVLPEELERARARGELLVFAGAGVSMASPACLPSFAELSEEIAGQQVLRDPNEPFDQYLERAAKQGLKVQERAREALQRRATTCNPMHEHLIGLFVASTRVQLVTTNFDSLFSVAADRVFPNDPIPHYVGPALPPGSDFRGIAHLHGCLKQEHTQLVLTQRDFAAAYITDGWATRFLISLFAQRVVLFVGHSLGDPVMRYLMSALPRSERWFALCHSDQRSLWHEHGVAPVTFDTAAGGDRFADLRNGISRWSWFARATAADHDVEMKRLIAAAPPSSQLDAGYIKARLNSKVGRASFWTAATDDRWFAWSATEGYLDVLYNDASTDNDASTALDVSQWARWCVANFCEGENPPLLQFARRRPFQLRPAFSFELAAHLSQRIASIDRDAFRQFVALLVIQPAASRRGIDAYHWLLQRVIEIGFASEALALLRWLTQVTLAPQDRLLRLLEDVPGNKQTSGSSETILDLQSFASRITINADPGDIEHLLESHGAKLAALAPSGMISIAEQRLVEAYALTSLAAGKGRLFDWLSYSRTAITPTNQDSVSDGEDILVRIAQIALDALKEADADALKTFACRYSADNRRLLKRLAIYAFACCPVSSSDELVSRAATEEWPHDIMSRPEVYLFLERHFDHARESTRRDFISALNHKAVSTDDYEDLERTRFNYSQLLARVAPRSRSARANASRERRNHPEWGEQDTAGYLSRIEVGWGVDNHSPVTPEALLELSPREALTLINRLLRAEKPDNGFRRTTSPLPAVQSAAATKPEWGIHLLVRSLTSRRSELRVVDALLMTLRDQAIPLNPQLEALSAITSSAWPTQLTRSVAMLVEGWAKRVGATTPVDLLERLDRVAELVFNHSRDLDSALLSEAGWTERAINHPAGYAALVWWHTAEARDRSIGKLSVSKDEKKRWTDVLVDETAAGMHARVILGMASDRFVSSATKNWATKFLYPLFDPSNDAERAAQLWDGRLSQTRWAWETVRALRPYLGRFFASSGALVPARASQLGDWVALLVANPVDSGFLLNDLHHFVHYASDAARHAFARQIPRHLGALKTEQRVAVWNTMLAPYWSDRRTGMPLALDVQELVAMIDWVIAVPETAPSAIALLQKTDGDALPHADNIIWNWREDDTWVRFHPTEAVKLIEWLATRDSIQPWHAEEAVPLLKTARESGATYSEVLTATLALAELPTRAAIEYATTLRREAGSS